MRSPVSKLGPVDLDYYHRNTSYMLRHDVVGIGGWEGGGLVLGKFEGCLSHMSTLFAGPSLPTHT